MLALTKMMTHGALPALQCVQMTLEDSHDLEVNLGLQSTARPSVSTLSMQAQRASSGLTAARPTTSGPFRQSRKSEQRPLSARHPRRRSLNVTASIIPTGNGIQRGVERFFQVRES